MITKRNIARGMMAAGSLVYLLGIWRTCPLFSGKGYFLGVLVMGMFAVLAHQRARQWQEQDDGFIALCRLVLLLSAGLLLVGAWYVPADWHEKAVYIAAWFVCLYGASATPNGPASPARQKRNRRPVVRCAGPLADQPAAINPLHQADSSRLPSRAALKIHTISSSGQRLSSRWLARSACTIRA
jgi:uncharacterized membrane protein YiaA